jgi:hypothetical protein
LLESACQLAMMIISEIRYQPLSRL